MLVVHHLGTSQSERIVWLCEELGLNYDLKLYKRSPLLSPPEYEQLHPIGAAPVIEDGETKIAESGACVEYIAQVHGAGKLTVKPGAKNYAEYLYWFHFANGTLQPALTRKMYLRFGGVSDDSEVVKRYDGRLHRILGFVDQHLARVPYLAGNEFTAADIMPVTTLTSMRQFQPLDLSEYTHILAWLERVTGRDAYKKAMQKADPDIDVKAQITGEGPSVFPALRHRS